MLSRFAFARQLVCVYGDQVSLLLCAGSSSLLVVLSGGEGDPQHSELERTGTGPGRGQRTDREPPDRLWIREPIEESRRYQGPILRSFYCDCRSGARQVSEEGVPVSRHLPCYM